MFFFKEQFFKAHLSGYISNNSLNKLLTHERQPDAAHLNGDNSAVSSTKFSLPHCLMPLGNIRHDFPRVFRSGKKLKEIFVQEVVLRMFGQFHRLFICKKYISIPGKKED